MRMRSLVASCGSAIALVSASLAGQEAAVGRIAFDTFSLPNGLQVITSAAHAIPLVTVDVWYNTGSRNEQPGHSGFAHLFEHMMFQGSAHVRKSEHFQLVQRAGGTLNGSTQEDRTNYWETLPSNRLNLGLWLEADRMRSLAITQANFDNQRETVKEERRLGVDNQPYGVAFTDGLTVPFDSATCFAYAHTVIGSMTDLNAAGLTDVQAFFDSYYAPNNATLVVVGDFDPATLRKVITQYFGSIPRHDQPPPVTCTYKANPGTVRRDFVDAHANLPSVFRLYRIPPHSDPDSPALELANIILGQGESSRLNVAVVRGAKAALATQAGIFSGARRGPNSTGVFGIANQGVGIERLDSLLSQQVDSLRQFGVTPEELTKAKNTFRAQYIDNRERTFAIAEELHHYAMFHNSLNEINSDMDRYLAVTSDDIKRVTAMYLDPANAVIITVKPAPPTAGGAQ